MSQHMSRRRFLKVTAGATALATSVDASTSLLVPTAQVASAAPQYVSRPTNRVRMLIDAGWQFTQGDIAGAQATKFNDSSWQHVNLPHSFDTPYFQATSWYQGYGWYRRHFTITANQKKARRISLEFEAAFQDAQVYVNGTLVGEHIGGFTGFIFDITSAVHEGDNVVAVRLNNKWNPQLAPRAGDYHFFWRYHQRCVSSHHRPVARHLVWNVCDHTACFCHEGDGSCPNRGTKSEHLNQTSDVNDDHR